MRRNNIISTSKSEGERAHLEKDYKFTFCWGPEGRAGAKLGQKSQEIHISHPHKQDPSESQSYGLSS